MIAVLWSALGLVVLISGAELLVRWGTRLAGVLGVRPILIGLTIVAVGTSSPEMAVGIDAALRGSGALAVGNLIGSGIYNILFILGVTALVPADGIAVESALLWMDLPIMALVTLLCLPVFATGRTVSHREGG